MSACSFCDDALAGDFYRFGDVVTRVIPTRSPRAQTHLLVVPVEHVSSLQDARPEVLLAVTQTIQQVARERGISDGYRVIFNVGAKGKQTVFHLHAHVLAGPEVGEEGFARSVT
jgi:diadenosine tetraphosphate (Ap4A) HIT family hydrolase